MEGVTTRQVTIVNNTLVVPYTTGNKRTGKQIILE